MFLVIMPARGHVSLLLAFDLPVLVLFGLVWRLHHRGNPRYWSLAATAGLWVFFTVGFGLSGWMGLGGLVGGFMVVLWMAGILLGFRWAVVFSALSLFADLGFALALQYGLLDVSGTRLPILTVWISQAVLICSTLGFVRLMAVNIQNRFSKVEMELNGQRQAQEQLAKVERRFRVLVENSTDMIAMIDGMGKVLYISPAVTRTLGYSGDEVVGQSSFRYIHPDDLMHVQSSLARLLMTSKGIQHIELRLKHNDGTWRWIEMAGSNFLFDPEVGGIILNYRDVSERKRQDEQRIHDVIHDELTGLYNRLLFSDRIENVLQRSSRIEEAHFTVMVLDIDHFRNINDALGYSAGDEILRVVGRRLLTCVRSSDTVARLGGDEFGILLDPTEGTQGAEVLAQRIRHELTSTPVALNEREVIVSCSIGVVFSPEGYHRPAEILRDAEIAMYRAKAVGRNQHIFFQPRMREQALERVGLEVELRRGLEKGEFVVYYQPLVSLQSGQLAGFEALIRWQHPTRGLLLPGSFLEVAEESGAIAIMDFWVMGEACRQMRVWQDVHPQAEELIININLSRRNLLQADLPERVTGILAETRLAPGMLRLEITEDLIMEDIESAVESLRQLDRLGVRPEIDDFGTGHSSLEVLATLPFVRTLKIGQNFVLAMDDRSDSYEVIRTIIALGHSLNKEVIAEGIETVEQLDLLRELGCEFGQGFYFAKGVCPAEAEKMIVNGLAEG